MVRSAPFTHHVAGAAPGLKAVVVDRQRDLAGRDRRMLAEVTRAQQARLLRSRGQEDRGAPRLLRQRGPGARDLQQHAAAGRVIHRAVINRVAIHRFADAQVIPVRVEHHCFGFQLRVAAFDAAPPRCASRSGESWRERCRESAAADSRRWKSRESADFSISSTLLPSAAAMRSPASLVTHPAKASVVRARRELHLLILAAPGGAHHVPSVAGRRRGVNDDGRGGAVARRFLDTCRSSARSR